MEVTFLSSLLFSSIKLTEKLLDKHIYLPLAHNIFDSVT